MLVQNRGLTYGINPTNLEQIIPGRTSIKMPEDRSIAIHLIPERIDLIDDSRGLGVRETLDF